MRTNDLAKLAASFAAGSMTYDSVLDSLGGDRSLADKVVGMAAGFGVGMIAGEVASKAVDVAREVPIVGDVVEVVDDFLGGLFDL